MTSTPKNKAVPSMKEASSAKRRPIKVFRLKDRPNVSCSVWDRQHQWEGESITFYSAQPQRSYERDGEKHYTSSFDSEDLKDLITILKDADEYIEHLKNPEAMLPKSEGEVTPE